MEGETIAISPVRMGDLPALIEALAPLAGHLGAADIDWIGMLGAADIDWIGMLGAHGREVITAVALCSGLPRERIERMLPDEVLALAVAAAEVNADFFVHRLAPAIAALSARVAALGTGGTSGS